MIFIRSRTTISRRSFTTALGKVLRRRGLQVSVASGGAAALEALGANAFDVVLLDVQMPGMDGTELLGRIQERAPRTQVILMTGHLRSDADPPGVFASVLKPHPLPDLLRLIDEATGRARA